MTYIALHDFEIHDGKGDPVSYKGGQKFTKAELAKEWAKLKLKRGLSDSEITALMFGNVEEVVEGNQRGGKKQGGKKTATQTELPDETSDEEGDETEEGAAPVGHA